VGEVPDEPKLDDLIVQALIHRPEVAQLRASRRTVDANLAYARDQLKPQLDLGVGYTSNGFAGVPTAAGQNPISASLASAGYGDQRADRTRERDRAGRDDPDPALADGLVRNPPPT